MTTEQWSTLMSWFYGRPSPKIPADVSDAIETLIEERQAEDDEEDDGEDEE